MLLLRAKLHAARRVARRDKVDEAVAQVADAVEHEPVLHARRRLLRRRGGMGGGAFAASLDRRLAGGMVWWYGAAGRGGGMGRRDGAAGWHALARCLTRRQGLEVSGRELVEGVAASGGVLDELEDPPSI